MGRGSSATSSSRARDWLGGGGSPASAFYPDSRQNGASPKDNFDKFVRMQEQLLQEGRKNQPNVEEDDVNENDVSVDAAMEAWIQRQCADMGLQDVRELDG